MLGCNVSHHRRITRWWLYCLACNTREDSQDCSGNLVTFSLLERLAATKHLGLEVVSWGDFFAILSSGNESDITEEPEEIREIIFELEGFILVRITCSILYSNRCRKLGKMTAKENKKGMLTDVYACLEF